MNYLIQENVDLSKGGIYQIRNTINNKVYVGKTTLLRRRVSTHFTDLKYNRHHNIHLQRSFNKNGIENFIFEILEYVETKSMLKQENFYISETKCFLREFGYNLIGVNENSETIWTDEMKENASKQRKGKKGTPHTEETKKYLSDINKGHNYTTKEYMGEEKWNNMLKKKSENLKNNKICSKEGFIERHGEQEGIERYDLYRKKISEKS